MRTKNLMTKHNAFFGPTGLDSVSGGYVLPDGTTVPVLLKYCVTLGNDRSAVNAWLNKNCRGWYTSPPRHWEYSEYYFEYKEDATLAKLFHG